MLGETEFRHQRKNDYLVNVSDDFTILEANLITY